MLDLWGRIVTKHPRWVVTCVLLIFIASILVSTQMKVEVRQESFEPRNPEYVRYHDILDKFSPETSSLLVIVTSPSGNVVDREAFVEMRDLERWLTNESDFRDNVTGVASPATSFLYAMGLLEMQDMIIENMSEARNETPDLTPIAVSMEKLLDAEARYTSLSAEMDENLTDDLRDVFLLLPRMSSGMGDAGIANITPAEFSAYTLTLNGSKSVETKINSTRIIREYLEILLNMSAEGDGGGGGMDMAAFTIPGEDHLRAAANWTLPWDVRMDEMAEGEDDVAYNVTYERIMSETSNRTFFEWYSLNTTLYLALTLVYSGNYELAEFIYVGTKGMVETNSQQYYSERDSWRNYSVITEDFLRGLTVGDSSNLSLVMEETDERIANSTGYLHDFLVEYRGILENYSSGAVGVDEAILWTWRANNVSTSLTAIYNYSGRRDVEILPYINDTIEAMVNGSHAEKVSAASSLSRKAEATMNSVMEDLVIPHMALNIMLQKFDICLKNALWVGGSDEPYFVRNATFSLALFPVTAEFSTEGMEEGASLLDTLYRAVRGLHHVLKSGESDDAKNSTATILWDYLTLDIQMPSVSVEFNDSVSPPSLDELEDEYLLNSTDDAFNENVERLLSYRRDRIYEEVNLTLEHIANISANLSDLLSLSEEVRTRYAEHVKEFSGDDRDAMENFIMMQDDAIDEMESAQESLDNAMDYVAQGRSIGQTLENLRDGFSFLLSKDLRDGRASSALMMIYYDGDSDVERDMYREISSYGAYIKFAPVSFTVLMDEIDQTAKRDMTHLLPISLLVLIVLLRVAYGNFRDTFLSLSAVVIVIAMMYAFATLMGWSFDPVLMAVPIMMVGMGIDYGIHLILRYREEKMSNPRRKAMYIAVVSVGTALLFTSITSMGGFLSNVVSSLEAIRRFSIMAAAGFIFSFVIMTSYIPAVKLLGHGKERRVKENLTSYLGTLGGMAAAKAPLLPIAVAVLFSTLGILSAFHLDTQFDMKDFAPEGSEIVERYDYISEHFNASQEYSYIYVEGNIATEDAIRAMLDVSAYLKHSPYVVSEYGVQSIANMLVDYGTAERGEIYYNETFVTMYREADTDGDGIPDRNVARLIAWLYENVPGAESLVHITRDDLYEAIFVVRTDSEGMSRVREMEADLWNATVPLKHVAGITDVEVTGSAIVSQATIDEINFNQMRSMFLSIAFSAILLTALFHYKYRCPELGLISALPIIFVVTWNWGVMRLLDIPLNVMTNTIAAICVGLGIDYGIHVTHRFLEESEKFYRVDDAVMTATNRIGRGLTGSSLTTITSVGVLTLSVIPPLREFALILAISIAFSYVSSLLVLPSLLKLWRRRRIKKGRDRVYNEVENALRLYEEALRTGDRRARMEALSCLCRHRHSVEKCLEYAEELEREGRYEEALAVYEEISDSRDVSEEIKRCIEKIKNVRGGFE